MNEDLSPETLLDCVQSLDDPWQRVLPDHVYTARSAFEDSLRVLEQDGAGEGKKNLILAATMFDIYAKLSLKGAGYAPTRTKVADLLGEARSSYSTAMSGKKCSVQRIFAWSARWSLVAPPLAVRNVSPPTQPASSTAPSTPSGGKEPGIDPPALSRKWFEARGCALPEPSFQSAALYDARVEDAYIAVGRAKVEKEVTWAAFKRSRIFLMHPTESAPARAFEVASAALVDAQRALENAKRERMLFREEHRRTTTSTADTIVNSRPALESVTEMEATAHELVGCYKQIVYAPSLEVEFLVETARRYDALARALLHREGRDERQRHIAYLVGERGAEYLSVIFGKLASREHLLRWWSNWPLFTLDEDGAVTFLPVPER